MSHGCDSEKIYSDFRSVHEPQFFADIVDSAAKSLLPFAICRHHSSPSHHIRMLDLKIRFSHILSELRTGDPLKQKMAINALSSTAVPDHKQDFEPYFENIISILKKLMENEKIEFRGQAIKCAGIVMAAVKRELSEVWMSSA